MTYAGLKSMIYANVKKDDPRVKAAVRWIREHYTLQENVGVGKQGLFYNYHTMAKALAAYGQEVLVDRRGVPHPWRIELINKLLSLQAEDGHWVNTEDRWWEGNPDLVTAYSILAMQIALEQPQK